MALLPTIALATYIICAFCLGIRGDLYTLIGFEVFLVLQNLALMAMSSWITPAYQSAFSAVKEIMLYGSLLLILIASGPGIRFDASSVLGALFLSVLLVNTLIAGSSINSAAVSMRQMLIPLICFFVGKNLNIKREDCNAALKSFVTLASILGCLGIVELLFLGDSFWLNLGIDSFLNKKGQGDIMKTNGMPASFYTYDFSSSPIRRLVSVTGEPLATAHLVFLGLTVMVAYCATHSARRHEHLGVLMLLGACCVLSLSKAVLIGIVVLAVTIVYHKAGRRGRTLLLLAGGAATLLGLVATVSVLASQDRSSSFNHVFGLVQGVTSGGLFGTGVGTSGFSTYHASQSVRENIGGESFIGVLASQTGLIGLLCFVGFYFCVFIRCLSAYKKGKGWLQLSAVVLFVMLFIDMLFSESSVSVTGTSLYFILFGLAYQNSGGQDSLSQAKIASSAALSVVVRRKINASRASYLSCTNKSTETFYPLVGYMRD